MPYVHVPMAIVAQQFKGTYDLAGAAEALHRMVPITWDTSGRGLSSISSLEQLYAVRRLCCYEFVHLAAYLSSQQKTRRSTPLIGANAGMVYENQASKVWTTGVGNLSRGKIVVFVAWGTERRAGRTNADRVLNLLYFNNAAGYYHVGISRGDGTVISLGSGSNIHIERLSDADDFYATVRYADYSWRVGLQDTRAPRLP